MFLLFSHLQKRCFLFLIAPTYAQNPGQQLLLHLWLILKLNRSIFEDVRHFTRILQYNHLSGKSGLERTVTKIKREKQFEKYFSSFT